MGALNMLISFLLISKDLTDYLNLFYFYFSELRYVLQVQIYDSKAKS